VCAYAALTNAAADATGAGGTQSDMKLATHRGTAPDPYAGFETRVVPENVTLLPKTKDQVTGGIRPANASTSSRRRQRHLGACATRAPTPEEARSHHRHARPARSRRRTEGKARSCGS